MSLSSLKLPRWVGIFDLHERENHKIYQWILAVILIALALVSRLSLFTFKENDFWEFEKWFTLLRETGGAAFETNFSVYNAPILLLFFLAGLLPIGPTVAIKGLAFASDIFLALSIAILVRHYFRKSIWPAIAAFAGVLFLPVVIVTGAWWGQFDQLFTGFLVLSLLFLLKDRSMLAWVFFGVALAVKLQAIFFLPVLIIASFRRLRLWHSSLALVTFLALSATPTLFGANLPQTLSVYIVQSSLGDGRLTIFAPNIYAWFTDDIANKTIGFEYLEPAGIFIAAAIMVATLMFAIHFQKFADRDIVIGSLLTSLSLFMFLPMMHERYTFLPALLAFVWVILYPSRLSFSVTLLLQLTTIFSYAQYLSVWELVNPPFSWASLALANFIALVLTAYAYAQDSSRVFPKIN